MLAAQLTTGRLARPGARLGAKPGAFIDEPAGESRTLVITEDSPEPAVIVFVTECGLICLDESVNGGCAAYENGFSALELTRKRVQGLEPSAPPGCTRCAGERSVASGRQGAGGTNVGIDGVSSRRPLTLKPDQHVLRTASFSKRTV